MADAKIRATICNHCPFVKAETRIKFACRERAEEIEEHAYRQGFPCHETAVVEDEESDEGGGYVFGSKSLHCAGAAAMFLNEDYDTWPGIENRELTGKELRALMKVQPQAFQCAEDFFAANEGGR